MTDRELLELAAKAYRIDVYFDEDGDCYRVKESGRRQDWNPLTDDGDALRLAVKLRLNLNFEDFDGMEYVCAVPSKSYQGYDEPMGDCETANTRRAVVRAAAEIEKIRSGT